MANRGGLAEPVRFALQLRYLRCNFSMLWHRMLKIWKGCWHWTMHGLYLRTLLLQSRMQADSVILPISNVAQTTQTLTLYRRNYFIKKKIGRVIFMKLWVWETSQIDFCYGIPTKVKIIQMWRNRHIRQSRFQCSMYKCY